MGLLLCGNITLDLRQLGSGSGGEAESSVPEQHFETPDPAGAEIPALAACLFLHLELRRPVSRLVPQRSPLPLPLPFSFLFLLISRCHSDFLLLYFLSLCSGFVKSTDVSKHEFIAPSLNALHTLHFMVRKNVSLQEEIC